MSQAKLTPLFLVDEIKLYANDEDCYQHLVAVMRLLSESQLRIFMDDLNTIIDAVGGSLDG